MRMYGVSMPIRGSAYIEVVADDEKQAVSIAVRDIGLEHVTSWDADPHSAGGPEIAELDPSED